MDKPQAHFYTKSMKEKYRIFVILLAFLLIGSRVNAQENSDYQGMIRAYSQALDSGDEKKVHEAWEALNRSAQALAHLRQSDPRLFQSFEYWRIKRELQELRRERALTLPDDRDRSLIRSRSLGERSNGERVRGNPNQDRTSNRSRVLGSPNQDRRPNQDVAEDAPNQDRSSNQERIRNRLRSGR